jgi:hypothetical protein
MSEYQPSNERLGKVKISVNSQVYHDSNGIAVSGNFLSNTEEMSESNAIRIMRPFIGKGFAVLVVPQYTSENEGKPNPNPNGKKCYWEWRSIDGEPFRLCIFEY